MIDWEAQPLRSLLFAPGNHERRLAKVASFGADVIVLDLEDAVADAEKEAARGMIRAALPSYGTDVVVCVRVNAESTGRLEDDLDTVTCERVDCFMVPKVEDPATLGRVDERLGELERGLGLAPGTIRLLALVETAKGIVRCEEIAAAAPERLVTIIFGLGDFSTDIGVDLTADATELLYARSRVVVAARAAGLRPALDGPYLDLQNIDGLVADSRLSRQLGFQGRIIIYPPHVDPTHAAYSDLAPAEVERARRIVEAFEQSESGGSASIQVDGGFVDYPIYQRARQKLKLYESVAAKEAR